MPLVTAPLFALNSQYRPNRFVVSLTSANPLVLAQASVVVYRNGLGIGVSSISKQPFMTIGTTYYFEFDVAKILQVYSNPKSQTKTSIFPDTLDIPLNVKNSDIHTEVGIIVSYYYNDPSTGLLTQDATIDTIPYAYPAIAGTRQTRDWNDMGMDGYIQQAGSGTSPYLTNAPLFYQLCRDENHYITFVPNTANAVRVITQDSAGAGIDTGLFAITPDPDYVPTTIGVGVPNLDAVTYFDGSVNINNPAVAQYQVQVGNAYFIGSSWVFVASSEIRVFGLIECCEDRRVRLHWINRLGGIDAYTFTSKKTVSERSKSQSGQKPLTWGYSIPPASSYDRGLYKIQTEAVKEYEVASGFYDESIGSWMAEILTSPEVYMETDYGLVSVIIQDSEIVLSESDELVNLVVKFTESNYISVQTN